MHKITLKIFNIKKREIWILILLCVQAVLTGAFIGGFDISVHAAFLKSFEYFHIPEALIISGISGLIIFLVYTFLSTRLPFRAFLLLNYLLLFVSAFAVYYVSAVEYNKTYIKIGYALMFPMNMAAYLNFWRSTREIFTPAQTKRLLIYVQVAFYGGIVSASYGSILYMYKTRVFEDIILYSTLAVLAIIFIQFILNPAHRFSRTYQHKPKKINPLRSKFYELFYSKYTILLLLFVTLSSMTGFLVHFNFIAATRDSYPDIVGFVKFLGLYMGTLFLLLFFVEKFLVRKILYSYDSPYSLVIIPAAMLIFVAISAIIFLTLGNSNFIARFSFYFMIIAAIKMVYEIARYNIEIPSLRVLFYTLDVRFHPTIIPRIEGTTRIAGMLLSGVILFVLLKIRFINLFYLNIVTALVVIAWFFVSVKLIKSYQDALLTNIKRYRTSKLRQGQELSATDEKLMSLINHGTPEKIISSLHISEKFEPIAYENHVVNLINIDSERVQSFVMGKIDEQNLLSATPLLKKTVLGPGNLEHYKNKLIEKFEQKISMGETEKHIERLANSNNINNRVLAAELIGYFNKKEYSSILINLSRDFEPDVKEASIKAMARTAYAENSHTLVGFLNSPVYYSYAFEALVKIGDDACEYLDQLFLSPDADNKLLSRIVKIYGKISSPKTIELLLNKLENQNKFIARQAILALREARFQASPGNINKILNYIVRTCNIMSWNLMVFESIPYDKKHLAVIKAMRSEIEENYNMLFNLLALAYNSNSIANIRKLIEEGSDHDISHAIELLDQIVMDEVKQVLFPLLENLQHQERIKKLQYYFPSEKVKPAELLPEIITRDFNLLSIYFKACAIFSWLNEGKEPDNILISCLFHPHKLIRETAAYVINILDDTLLQKIYPRLEPEYVADIQSSLFKIQNGADLLMLDKVDFLKGCYELRKIPEDILFEIAMNLKYNRLQKGQDLVLTKNSRHFSLLFIYQGTTEITSGENSVELKKGDIIYTEPFLHEAQNQLTLKALDEVVLFSLDKDILHLLIFDYTEIRSMILGLIETTV
ncbi:MAG: hypothetical protein JXB00_17590 [Bacteroidales bacterium]|nr:hypothetical protein [Bacteroidales bacterium]